MDDLTTEEIVLAGLGKASRGNRSTGLKNTVRSEMGASRFRKQFLERIHMLPKDIQKALLYLLLQFQHLKKQKLRTKNRHI